MTAVSIGGLLTLSCIVFTCIGTPSQVFDSLQTFGIPRSDIPATDVGDLIVDLHLEWLKNRRCQEQADDEKQNSTPVEGPSSSSTARIVLPSRADILLGRGKKCQNHVGNMRLHLRLDQKREAYYKMNRRGKRMMALEVIDAVQNEGGRFIKQSEYGTWEAIDHDSAVKKVIHDFRTARKGKAKPEVTAEAVTSESSCLSKRPREEKCYSVDSQTWKLQEIKTTKRS
jgi:hypothetical protein